MRQRLSACPRSSFRSLEHSDTRSLTPAFLTFQKSGGFCYNVSGSYNQSRSGVMVCHRNHCVVQGNCLRCFGAGVAANGCRKKKSDVIGKRRRSSQESAGARDLFPNNILSLCFIFWLRHCKNFSEDTRVYSSRFLLRLAQNMNQIIQKLIREQVSVMKQRKERLAQSRWQCPERELVQWQALRELV